MEKSQDAHSDPNMYVNYSILSIVWCIRVPTLSLFSIYIKERRQNNYEFIMHLSAQKSYQSRRYHRNLFHAARYECILKTMIFVTKYWYFIWPCYRTCL